MEPYNIDPRMYLGSLDTGEIPRQLNLISKMTTQEEVEFYCSLESSHPLTLCMLCAAPPLLLVELDFAQKCEEFIKLVYSGRIDLSQFVAGSILDALEIILKNEQLVQRNNAEEEQPRSKGETYLSLMQSTFGLLEKNPKLNDLFEIRIIALGVDSAFHYKEVAERINFYHCALTLQKDPAYLKEFLFCFIRVFSNPSAITNEEFSILMTHFVRKLEIFDNKGVGLSKAEVPYAVSVLFQECFRTLYKRKDCLLTTESFLLGMANYCKKGRNPVPINGWIILQLEYKHFEVLIDKIVEVVLNGRSGLLCAMNFFRMIEDNEFVNFACHHLLQEDRIMEIGELYLTQMYGCRFFLDLMSRGIEISKSHKIIISALSKMNIVSEVKFLLGNQLVREAVEHLIEVIHYAVSGESLLSQELYEMLNNISDNQENTLKLNC